MEPISARRALTKASLTLLATALSACATLDAPSPAVNAAAQVAKTNAETSAPKSPTAIAPVNGAKAADEKASSAKAAPAPAAPGAPPSPKPFAEVIKDAKEDKGFFTTWHKDDKVWIEIPENMWDRPFFFSVNVTNAIGDAGIFGNQMGGYLATGRGSYMASFRKFGTQGVQMIARNTAHAAADNSPAKAMIDRAFSDSLIGTATIVSAPHPERKSV